MFETIEPFKPSMAEEVPLVELPDEPHFSENYCYYTDDHERDIGLWLHCGRWGAQNRLWREQLYIYLPGNTVLIHRSIGAGDLTQGPTGGLMKLICLIPGQRWRVDYEGPMLVSTDEELMQAPLRETIVELVRMSVTFEGQAPVLLFPNKGDGNTSYGRWHYEQLALTRGAIEFRGRTYEFDGRGYTDHTRGPRHVPQLRRHFWTQGHFPEGGGFSIFEMWEAPKGVHTQVLDDAVLMTSDSLTRVPLKGTSLLWALSDIQNDIIIRLETPNGPMELVGKPLRSLPYSYNENFDFLYGLAPSAAPFSTIEQPVRFDLNGKTVFGHAARLIYHGMPTAASATGTGGR